MNKNILKVSTNIIQIIIGALTMAFGISMFLLPNQLSSGGFSGIATIFYYCLNIPMGTTILMLNVPLFIFSFFKVGKKFFFRALFGTICLSLFIDLFGKITPFTDDLFLDSIYGGIIIGIGNAIILKANASTGGTELIISIIKEYRSNLKTGNMLTIVDIVIVTINVIVFGRIEIGLYSAIAIYIIGIMIDLLFEGINFSKLIFIISDKAEEISEKINLDVKKGTTGLYGKGMYTNTEKVVLFCAASRREIIKIKEITNQIDANSFIIISNAREVFGKGFKRT